jgi:hypothetical protein
MKQQSRFTETHLMTINTDKSRSERNSSEVKQRRDMIFLLLLALKLELLPFVTTDKTSSILTTLKAIQEHK